MPVAESRGAWLSWDAHGEGEPVLLVMGLAGSGRAWHRLLPHVVAAGFRAIRFDHRGTGQSDRVSGPQTMADLVDDCLAVLDAAGEDDAHVFGVSMGGMVAQHLALDHRQRVRSLLLGCTTAGGRTGPPPWRMLAASALRPVLGAGGTWPVIAPALYARRTRQEHPDRLAEDRRIRMQDDTPTATVLAQMAAIARHDVRDRLPELAGLPVTVLHGDEDVLMPPEAGRRLAEAIPGAVHVAVAGAAHMLSTDAEQEVADAVRTHLLHASDRNSAAVRC